ncbi:MULTISPECIES: diaminopimelate decarboxylase [Gammaproteobacteria]|uniref:diaminopimelate decarboxylase n=1 Tax=Gammaproteobacteria TaxID=1236 RepID=UPI000DCFA21D|nr:MULTISPECIES: diaminopimelate decarboxylase [Gammaproteobacteria]RTE85962.1 diaminopimelate decarboxylase [Aliidiomarina sp. B3213]TCZ90039.1 diaminopimelate decarboxylase [Lysobacter sp. N42]
MSGFYPHNGQLYAENTPLLKLAATHGTPLYVYSKAVIERNWRAFTEHLPAPHRAHYAVKANSNLAVLQILARLGAGFDVVSGGEIARVLKAGGEPHKIVFSGVAKSDAEISEALRIGIGQFNVESLAELNQIHRIASQMRVKAPISLRVNPDVDAKTHPYIATGLEKNKFGIPMHEAVATYRHAATLDGLEITGVDCHIGSQITELQPFLDAMDRMLALVDELEQAGIQIKHLDMGGGLGVCYQNETPPQVGDYIQGMLKKLESHPQLSLFLEPGRAIVSNAGVMLTQVTSLKANGNKHFIMVDGGMNDLIRPSLYQAWHDIVNVAPENSEQVTGDIVGPVCETGDFFGQNRTLAAQPGDILAIKNAGAYGFVMSSNYNSRPRPPEVLVDGDQSFVIRARETQEDLWKTESLLP